MIEVVEPIVNSSTAPIITAVATVITAIGGLILAFGVLIPILKTVKVTHVIVNQQHTDQQRFIIALTQKLIDAGIEVPIDQSKPVPGHPDAKPGQPSI